jgi:hypothetical protein
MNMMQSVGTVAATVTDRVMAALISGLEVEFGKGVGEALAHRFLEAEEVDFNWNARVWERWIGSYEGDAEEGLELDRIKVLGRLDDRWFVAVIIVDGDGNAHGMMGRRTFGRRGPAEIAYLQS